MDIDELMRAPGMRWIFRMYAIAAGVGGAVLFGWGPVWFGTDLPELPNYKASLVRLAGGVLMAAACCVAAFDGIEEPRARRKALLWLAAGHGVLFLVVLSQQKTIWESPVAKAVLMFLILAVFAFLFLWSGTDVGGARSPNQLISLFGQRETPVNLEQRYRSQIRAAALQEERHRLARDLHDSVKQQIFAIQTAAATAQTRFDSDAAGTRAAIDQVRASAREAMAEMEAMLDNLRAAPLETVGLVEALRKQCEALGFRTGAQVDFQVGGGLSGLTLAPGGQEAVFRIAQEALANVGRHARAAHVTVAVFGDPHWLRLTVSDDGQGFDPEQAARGMGLGNMRTRAAEFGGTLELNTAPGGGTQITVAVPVMPRFSVADYNRRILWYVVGAVTQIAMGLFQHSLVFALFGVIWVVYAVRIAIERSAALARPEVGR